MKLPRLNLLMITFRLQARESVILPPFLGSTLRGAFGTALKKVFCFVPHGECERCWFFEACPYQYIFESPNLIPAEENHSKLRGQREVPQPFVMIAPNPVKKRSAGGENRQRKEISNFNEDYARNHFSTGETLEFSILLVGKAARYWAQALVAARLLGEDGLGEIRAPFTLTEAYAHDARGQRIEVFNLKEGKVSTVGVSPVSLERLVDLRARVLQNKLKNGGNKLKIEFQTPTRIRISGEIKPTINFSDILKKITERLEFLALLHADQGQIEDYRPLLQSEYNFLLTRNALKVYRYEQFSNAQNRKTRREVVLGELEFEIDAELEILPFLIAGEFINIGTNTSYGFGKFIVDN